MLEQKRFIKYWFVFFISHIALLFFVVWNVYAFRRLAPDAPEIYVTNDLFFNSFLFLGLILFFVSLFCRKSFRGFVLSFALCFTVSLLGFVAFSAINTFYFLLWFIIGISGMGIHLLRYQNLLEKNKNAE